MNLKMKVLDGKYGVCRLNPNEKVDWEIDGFYSITMTQDELSVVCTEKCIPQNIKYEGNWRVLKVEGPLDFSLIGILSFISSILAEKGISIFAISTFDTDYILVKTEKLLLAKAALVSAGVIF